jgi:hypothetical protein
VAVEVHRRPDGGVAESNLDGLRVHAELDEDRRVRVPEVVRVAGEADGGPDRLRPRTAPEVIGAQRVAELAGEDQRVRRLTVSDERRDVGDSRRGLTPCQRAARDLAWSP